MFKVYSVKNTTTDEQTDRHVNGKEDIHTYCLLINTTTLIIIMGFPGEWKERESFEERDMNVVSIMRGKKLCTMALIMDIK